MIKTIYTCDYCAKEIKLPKNMAYSDTFAKIYIYGNCYITDSICTDCLNERFVLRNKNFPNDFLIRNMTVRKA
jgi:hypothetical protein